MNVGSRELRNNTRGLLDRVERGETITITVDGRPVARLEPVQDRPQWLSREDFIRRILPAQADPGLGTLLRDIAPDSTDELPVS